MQQKSNLCFVKLLTTLFILGLTTISALAVGLGYENSTWVEDWTKNLDATLYINALPKGVNTINVFVGQLALVDGMPSINGYTIDTPGAPNGRGSFPNLAALTDFVHQCKAAGCSVTLSIGGASGTTFGNSWNCLTKENITPFAKTLISFCNTTGADGIDFDDELDDTTVASLAGALAGTFKDLAPQLATSYCVFGGCDANGPWHGCNTSFLDTAVTSQNWCAIDRIYVMTYWDYCSLSQNEGFMTAWSTWLAKEHGFTPQRISAGIDPNDPSTSLSNGTLNAWIGFAASNSFSTAIWDNSGVDDYVNNNWGTVISNLYHSNNNKSSWSWRIIWPRS